MAGNLKILHLEDSRSDALIINKAIKKAILNSEIFVVDTREDYIKALTEFSPDIILSDHSLPSFNSYEALEILHETGNKIPFILITATMRDEFAIDIIKKGADDYILKDRLHRLPSAIHNFLEKFRLEKERQDYINELVNKERRYRSLIENSTDAIVILNTSGNLTYVSPSINRVIGYSEDEALRLSLEEILHPEDQVKVFQKLKECLVKPAVPIKVPESRIKNKAGNYHWMEATFTNMLHEPAINGIVNNFRDITERKLAEQSILESEEKYRSFFENSLDGILLTVTDGNILAANPAACRIFQMTETEICETGRFGLVDPTDPRLAPALAERQRTGKAQAEITMVRKDGTKFPGEITSVVIKNGTGQDRTSMIIRDVTDRKLAEKELKSSEEQYKQLFQFSPLPQWIFDLNTYKILDVNETAITHYGYSRNEFLQMTIMDIRPEEDISKILHFLQKNKNKRDSIKFGVINHLKKDKTPIKAEVSGYRLNYKGWDCMMVICHDITEKEAFLQRLKDKRDKLLLAQSIAKLGYWDHNLNDNSIYWTDEIYKIWGRNKETFKVTPDTLLSTVHPDDLETFRKEQVASFAGKQELNLEHRIILPDGTIKWVHGRGTLVKDDQEKPIFFRGTFQDITERKEALEQLSISEARHRAIIHSQTNYSIRTNLKGEYTFCNDKFLEDFSWIYPDNIIMGKNSMTSINEYHHQRVIEIANKCINNLNTVYKIEMDKPKQSGAVRTTIWDFICLPNAKGEPSEIQCIGIDITEQVQSRKKIERSEKQYRQIVETAQEGIWLIDENHLTTFVNKKMGEIFEYTEEEMLGKDITYFMDEEGKQKSGKLMDAKKAGKSGQSDFKYISKSGKEVWTNVSANPIFDEEGNYKGALAMVSDITEKKKLAELLKAATHLARIGSYEADLINNLHYWSPMMREIYEVDEDFIPTSDIKMGFFEAGASREMMTLALHEAVENNIPYDMELQIITAKGNKRWVRDIGKAEFKEGKCIRIYGSIQDIDKTRTAELHVLNAFEEKVIILESIGDAFYALDLNWVVTYWNKEAERLLKCPKNKIIGKNFWDVFANAKNTSFYTFYHQAFAENTIQHFEAFYEDTESWYDVTAYPSLNGLSVYFKDVSERKLSELRLQKLNANLQTYTEELVMSNKGLEQFSYIVSHNLRAPVANIMGLAEMLNKGIHPPEIKDECLKGLLSNVKRLDQVIIDLNSILKLKKDISENKETINLDQLVANIKSSIQHLFQTELVQIKTDFSAVPEIVTVKSYIHSIFYNLISNSIKYRQPDLLPIIQINSELIGNKVIIKFKDNGLGIDLTKKKDEVFGLYKRFHLHVEGKGIGLFMVKTQVEALGGKIYISSEKNIGTEFKIQFNYNLAGKIQE